MIRISIIGLSLTLLLAVASPSRADDAEKTAAIIDKAIKATGGAEKLEKNKAFTWKDKGTYYGMGSGLPYTAEYAAQYPDRIRMEITDLFTIVFNGKQGWVKTPDATMEMTKEQVAEYQESSHAGWAASLVPLKDKAFTLSLVGDEVVDKQPAVAVNVAYKGRRDVTLLFDKKTGLLVQTRQSVKSQEEGGKEVQQIATMSEYKDFDGVKMPTKTVVKRDGKDYVEAEMSEAKFSEKLDDSVFEKP